MASASGIIVHDADDAAYLTRLGDRVREARARRGLTRRALAAASGVSERYLAHLESGHGNPSIVILRQVARALGGDLGTLVADAAHRPDPARDGRIALVGLRGAGKTTLGARLAERLGVPFVELDREVERDAGTPLAGVFEIYGPDGYRRLERAALERVVETHGRFVLAAGGSIVSAEPTYERLLATCFTVWLRATPEDHMARVVAQGDTRPMAGRAEAMADLRRILADREALYARADATIETSGRTVDRALRDVLAAVPRPAS